MIKNIVKYRKSIFEDVGLYLSIFIPLIIFYLLKPWEMNIVLDKGNVFNTSVAIIALSIGFCYQAFNYLNDLDTNDLFYKKLLKTEIFDEIHFLFTYSIYVSALNIITLVIFTIFVWFGITNDFYLVIIGLVPSIFTFYTLSEFINFYRSGVGLKKYKLEFDKIQSLE
ncbi:hypothetical protein [Methanolobus chelungpuianus]|uniref:Uncharacterized protein n=1 Tax=Methanolobus chelungpuianus TaxID=502115 RepID=A0AAE3HCI0_9EURY|nr:hypothetical protein [Methanolobus chelungpuianus]MCQ6963564.1 hypothetical protein [Methanolobus chelungpuianus]